MKNLTLLLVLLFGLFAENLKAGNGNDVYQNLDLKMLQPKDWQGNVYQCQSLHVRITMPADWQGKVNVDENDQTVTVNYINPGGKSVFLYSITKISQQTWMNLKDQMTDAHIVSQKDGMVYFVILTDKNSIKGPNEKEYKSFIDHIADIPHSVEVN